MEEFYLEQRLRALDPALHTKMTGSIFALQKLLLSFLSWFPSFTDHSILHSMHVLDFCNRLIGEEQVGKLNAKECYVLIMACYLHDIGMGVTEKDFHAFSEKIDFGDYFQTHDKEDISETIRAFHQEFSGLFIQKYADLFEIPSEELVFAIVQTSRGHRQTDLYDETEFPQVLCGEDVIRLPYLAAVMRLADEIDVAADRNLELLFDASTLTRERDILAFGTHDSIRSVSVEQERIVLYTRPKEEKFIPLVEEVNKKIQTTLDYCKDVARKRSDLLITQTTSVVLPEESR
ncbi:MAG: HD domain-containing protein [Lachnospiraceae bacterium]|nr:HD domain-containing protein [Lachnospiraceae bacterium]